MFDMDDSFIADYKNSRLLITGGTGYIGSSLLRALKAVKCQIILLVRPERCVALDQETVAEISVVSGDLSTRETWLDVLKGVDYVFHLAAQTSAYVADRQPFTDLNLNVIPVLHMLEASRELSLPAKIVFAGTVTETGITAQTPVDETFPDHPITIYDIHKLTAEKYLQYYARQTAVETVTLRLPNVYGPGPSSGRADRGLLNQMVLRALRGEALTVYGEGAFVRDYVFIDDVIRAFLTAGSRIDALSGKYYVIGSGVGTQFVDALNLVADRVALVNGYRPSVAHMELPPELLAIESRNFVANTVRFSQATGWSPEVSLVQGIDHTIAYYLDLKNRDREARE